MPMKRKTRPTIRTQTTYRQHVVGWVTWGEDPRPVTDYTITSVRRMSGFNHPSYVWRDAMNSWCYGQNHLALRLQKICMQRAYARFRAQVTDRAEMGLFLAERKEAADLIALRLTTLASAARALRRGNLRRFARYLGIQLKRKHRQKGRWFSPRMFSNLWLEYWFGWAPMLGDIFNALEVLESPYPEGRARGSATIVEYKQSENNQISPYHMFYGHVNWRYSYHAKVSLTNPLLYRASQLGVINPATILWQLVPFSFVVDWLIPVKDFLETPTEFAGLELSRKFTTMKSSMRTTEAVWNSRDVLVNAKFEGITFSRRREFETPQLVWDIPTGLSLTRGATVISLLISLLSPNSA